MRIVFLATSHSTATADWREPATYVAAFEQRFLHLLRAFVNTMATEPSVAVGVQRHSVACFALSNAYANLLLVKNFADAVRSTATLSGSSASLDVLRLLSHLFALSQLQQDAGEFMESGAVVAQDMPVVRSTIEALLLELRPHAVKLVDGFNFSDRTLNSALGRGDGNVYEALYASAQLDPLNGCERRTFAHSSRARHALPPTFSSPAELPMTSPLDAERQRSALSARDLAAVVYGGRANVERLERLEALLAADPAFANTQEMDFLPRAKQYERALRMAGRVEILARRHALSDADAETLRHIFQAFTSCSSATTLHTLMFIKNLSLLFTDEQQAKWMDLAKQWRMIGCYAQTELGHGSNVRALETTATFLPDSDEFEIHSPTLTSLKWWPGALARTANFGVVYARLILADGKDYGVHNFMVQLRDLETHAPMPGVTLGDVGPKIGFNNVDNGYARFTRVRIPREQMGMRVSKVTRDGKYIKQAGVPKEVLYFTMLQTRMVFVRQSGVNLAKASTIAIRYSAVRRQGYDAAIPNATEELQVLDYQTQQFRLLPLLAGAYAIMLTGNRVDQFAIELSTQTKSGDVRLLNVGHAMSCGLKVLCTELSNAGLETCRRACGGHGYLLASGLPVLLGDQVQTVTTEGDNYVLTQQTARALLKILADFKTGKTAAPPMLESLVRLDQPVPVRSTTADWREPATYVAAFEQRFLHLLRAFVNTMATEPSVAVGVQRHSVACFALSNAYANLLLVKNFADAVRSTATLSGSSASLDVLRLLSHLFALSQLQQDAGEFMESGAVVAQDMPVVRSTIEALLLELRPHAVKLVDGFNFSDRTLNSALGRGDGNVYEALYASAQLDPLNGGDAAASGEVARRELLLPIREELSRLSRL